MRRARWSSEATNDGEASLGVGQANVGLVAPASVAGQGRGWSLWDGRVRGGVARLAGAMVGGLASVTV